VKLRCCQFWIILATALLTGTWWVLYVPYKPDSILMAIPSDATFVSVHKHLATELDPLLGNQVVRSALVSAGVKESDLDEFATNRVAHAWINRLASDQTVVAYVPALGYQRKPAWICASWIGNESQKFRWKLFWFRPKMIQQTATEYGRNIYSVRMRLSDPNQRLSVALTEGVLVGCLSEDPTAARYLVQSFDRQYGRTSIVSDGTLAKATALLPPHPPHWGWIRTPRAILPPRDIRSLLVYGVNTVTPSNLSLSLALNRALPLAPDLADNPGIAPLLQTLGTSPDFTLIMPLIWMQALLHDQQALPLWVNSVLPLVGTNPASSLAFISILNHDHSGRIRGPLGNTMAQLTKGLRVPTLLLGMQVDSEEEVDRRISTTLDQINSRYGSSLLSHPTRTPNGVVTLIEESRKGLYKKFEPDERVAWTYHHGWMFLASNAGVLKRLTGTAPTLGSSPAQVPAYTPWVTQKTPAEASFWVDAVATARLINNAASAATLALMISDSESAQATRQNLETLRGWVEKIQTFRDITATAHATNGVTHMEINFRSVH
jgi:hypothetical protein